MSIRRTVVSFLALLIFIFFVFQIVYARNLTEYQVEGLIKGAEILKDEFGVPHIYGKTEEDMFFAQGFNAARERLWQLDLWRKQGEGKLSEAFGERFLDKDVAARLFLYRGDIEKEFRSYHPRGKKILTAFTKGINAYIDLTRSDPSLLPFEFELTGTTPGYWSPTSSLIRIFGLTRNISSEVRFARLLSSSMDAELIEKLHIFEPPTELEVPDGLDVSLIDEKVLQNYSLARGGITFTDDDIVAKNITKEQKQLYACNLSTISLEGNTSSHQAAFESNNWTISGDLTRTGRPILANDPHRAHTVPSLRYIAHINGPGWNVIGAGEPALPGISIGHNDDIAFGLTIFSFADEEDLYVYDLNPENPLQYWYENSWKEMRVITESFNVKGKGEVTKELKFTRHGPVIYEDLPNNKAYALRAAYLEHEGTSVYLPSLRVDQAKNWREFERAMELHYTPSENMVYADKKGNIGWFGCSIAPIRRNWTGVLPVPGNGDYEWRGFLNTKKLPRILNPVDGYFASANQYNIPDGYRYTELSNRQWSDPYRFDRVMEVLNSGKKFTLRDSRLLQNDYDSLPAQELQYLLNGLQANDADVNAALSLLRAWNGNLSKESIAAAIYEIWVLRLTENVFNLYVPEDARSIFGSGNLRVLIQLLSLPDDAFGSDPIKGRNDILILSLEQALDFLKEKLGSDTNEWKWGNLHHSAYDHTLSSAVDDNLKTILNVPPIPRGGDAYTVNNTGYRSSDFRQTGGASFRIIVDVGNWDYSLAINTPGQSGDPLDLHYADLHQWWADGKYFSLLFSRDKIEEITEEKIILSPKK